MNGNGKLGAYAGRAVMLAAALCALLPSFAAAQGLPLDDKARYEKSLENKVEEVLLKLLGPNQAKVVVQATMDFSRIEKVDVTKGGGAEKAADGTFKWQSPATEGQPFNEYLLPGFPSMNADSENQSYQKQLLYPASFIKKLLVTVVVNKEMSEADSQTARSVVSEVLGLDPQRGDDIVIIRTQFAPIWRTIWYDPDSVAMIFKYSLLTMLGIISMMVVAVGFLKLTTAMNTMAKAQQSHQITMDLGKGGGGPGGAPAGGGIAGGGGGGGGGGKLELDITERKSGGGQTELPVDQIFDVKIEQADFLVNLMAEEDPANIALVAGHLPENVKTEFLRLLPTEVSTDVVANLAKVRFVDPEVVQTIREEIEKRLQGAFGGLNVVIDALDKVNLRAKRDMMAQLESRHPEIAGKVRKRILLPEDLLKLTDKDLGILATTVKIEDWSVALVDMDAAFRDKLKGQLTDKTWMMLEQTMKFSTPTQGKIDSATEAVVNTAIRLINDGRIANPLKVESPQEATQPAPVPPPAPAPAAPVGAAAGQVAPPLPPKPAPAAGGKV